MKSINIKNIIINTCLFILVMIVMAKVISHFLVYEPQNQSQFSKLKSHQKPSDSQLVLKLKQNKKTTVSLKKDKGVSRFKEIREYMDEFDIPQNLKNDLLDSAQEKTLKSDWADQQDINEQLTDVELLPKQVAVSNLDLKSENLTEGFSVSDRVFNEMYEAALPSGKNENTQSSNLKSQALADLGFSAIFKLNYEQAEKAFKAVLKYYADTKAAPIVQLEYSQLLLETQRPKEASAQIDAAIDKYSGDTEFVEMAQRLKDEIEEYE